MSFGLGSDRAGVARHERGVVLLQAVMLVFALFGIAAAVIDVGIARHAQLVMQGAADAAALDGMRYRDALGDEGRRERARDLVVAWFDDGFGEAGDELGHGAGPQVELTGGIGDFHASATFTVLEPYVPDLQLNLGNEEYGDLFAPSDAEFLVRLRRTPLDSPDAPFDRIAGVSSAGPPLPYLFGRGSLIGKEQRVAGITVRATAIATARPALALPPAAWATTSVPRLPLLIPRIAIATGGAFDLAMVREIEQPQDRAGVFIAFEGSTAPRTPTGVGLSCVGIDAPSGYRVAGFVIADLDAGVLLPSSIEPHASASPRSLAYGDYDVDALLAGMAGIESHCVLAAARAR
jgi:hypothetical protein